MISFYNANSFLVFQLAAVVNLIGILNNVELRHDFSSQKSLL